MQKPVAVLKNDTHKLLWDLCMLLILHDINCA